MTTITGTLSFSQLMPNSSIPGYVSSSTTDNIDVLTAPNWPGVLVAEGLDLLGPLTSNEPITLVASTVSGHLITSFFSDFYNRILIFPNPMTLGLISASSTKTVFVWNGFLTSQTLNSTTGSGTDGLTLTTSGTLPLTFTSLEVKPYSLAVNISGPPTISALFTYNFAGTTVVFSVLGSRVLTIPFIPLSDFSESHSWGTDVIKTKASESRLQYRPGHRKTLKYNYQLFSQEEYGRAKVLANYAGTYTLGIPEWDRATLFFKVLAGVSILELDTSELELTIGDTILLWSSSSNWEVTKLTAFDSVSVTIDPPVQKYYPKVALVKILFGTAPSGISFTRGAGKLPTMEAEFLTLENFESPAWPIGDTFLGLPVIIDKHPAVGSKTDKFLIERDTFDPEIGDIVLTKKENTTKTQQNLTLLAKNKSEKYVLKRQMDYLQGRFSPFFMLTGNMDLIPAGSIVPSGVTVKIKNAGLSRYGFKDIRITSSTGTYYDRHVTSVNEDADPAFEIIHFTPAITPGVSVVTQIEFLIKSRLDSDTVEFSHSKNTMKVSVPVVEVP